MKLIKFPSIEQYRNVIRNVQHKSQFIDFDDNNKNKPKFNLNASMPILSFEGTVKLHGTNAGVVISKNKDLWCQSRERIITPESDNAGFAMFAYGNKQNFMNIADEIKINDKDIVIFGEWCGGNIQKNVAICQLPKMFVIFNIALVDEEGNKIYLTESEVSNVTTNYKTEQIKVIYDFPTWYREINFNNPELFQNDLNYLTEKVEEECPVGKQLGVSGVGEGIVWKCITPGYNDSGFWFKVKGEKHSKSKIKTLATVDMERIENINKLSEKLANKERLDQIHQIVFDTLNGGQTDIKRMGEFIKSVMSDMLKEELDVISASGFSTKDITSNISKICRNYILDKL